MATGSNQRRTLIDKLDQLPPERVAEVEDFVDFLARKEARSTALDKLLAIAPALDAAGVPRITEEEIVAEVKVVRAERQARPVTQDPKTKDRT